MTLRYIDKRKPTTTARILNLLESVGVLPVNNHAPPAPQRSSDRVRGFDANRIERAREAGRRAQDNARIIREMRKDKRSGGTAA